MSLPLMRTLTLGSPPLTRGPLHQRGCVDADLGITPAYAGTTCRWVRGSRSTWDHPRLRGDHRRARVLACAILGSPPLTRGPRQRIDDPRNLVRITPAYAGTTRWYCVPRCSQRDHPRLRGDHILLPFKQHRNVGSPPLTRGPHLAWANANVKPRITPAYAGTTVRPDRTSRM